MKNSFIIIALIIVLLLFLKKVTTKEKPIKHALPNKKMTKEQFKNFLLPSAKAIEQKTGIPYKFLMAQMALETGWGKSELFYKHNNVGGIRSFNPDKENHANYWTFEHVKKEDLSKWDKYERDKKSDTVLPNGKVKIKVKLPFMSYPDLVTGLKSYLDKVLLNKYFKNYISEANGDPFKYAELLQSKKYGAMYATDTNYVPKIHSLIKSF